MILKIANKKAVQYSCKVFHYAKSVPIWNVAFSVFNELDEWCGCIVFGRGANNNLAGSLGLPQGGCVELVRVALNGKQGLTGKALSIALRILPSHAPLCRVVVSYADPEQGHIGILYQATNWIYLGRTKPGKQLIDPKTGKVLHKRTAHSKYGTAVGFEKTKAMFKEKYAFPLNKRDKVYISGMAKPYPKCV